MPIIVVFIGGGAAVGVLSGTTYEDHSASYSDYAERKKKATLEEQKKLFEMEKKDFNRHLIKTLQGFKDEYDLKFDISDIKGGIIDFNSFETEIGHKKKVITQEIHYRLSNDLKKAIRAEKAIIKEIDDLILKVEKIRLDI